MQYATKREHTHTPSPSNTRQVKPRPPSASRGSHPRRLAHLVRCLEKSVQPRDLIDKRDVQSESVERGAGGLREVGAIERIGVIEELDPADQGGHGRSINRGRNVLEKRGWGGEGEREMSEPPGSVLGISPLSSAQPSQGNAERSLEYSAPAAAAGIRLIPRLARERRGTPPSFLPSIHPSALLRRRADSEQLPRRQSEREHRPPSAPQLFNSASLRRL